MTENVGPETGNVRFWFPGMASLQHESNRALGLLCLCMCVGVDTHTHAHSQAPVAALRAFPTMAPPSARPPSAVTGRRDVGTVPSLSRDFRGRLLPELDSGVIVQSMSRAQPFITAWTAARLTSLSLAISRSLLRLMSIASVMPSSPLVRCRPLLLPSASGSSPDGRYAASSDPGQNTLLGKRRAAVCAGVGAVLLPSVTCTRSEPWARPPESPEQQSCRRLSQASVPASAARTRD